jgi:hypothetical protein
VTAAVAIISVVSTAVVAISVPFINAWLERQRLRYQGTQERFAELRTLLDEAAQRLTEGHTVLVQLISAAAGKSGKGVENRLTELAVEVFEDNTRLALRLGGGHRLHQAHAEAMGTLHHVEGAWRTQREKPTTTDLAAFDNGLSAFMHGSLDLLAVPVPEPNRGGPGSTI